MGVWIETATFIRFFPASCKSHPAWVCGLKPELIEENPCYQASHPAWVCGLKLRILLHLLLSLMSHPAWVCGLKRGDTDYRNIGVGHTLRGCVD